MHVEDAYLFHHALIRDAGYQLQLPIERAVLHGIAAELLAPIAESAEEASEVAFHYRLSSEVDESSLQDEKDWLERSYALATAHHRHDVAIRSLARLVDHPLTDDSQRAEHMHSLIDTAQKGSFVDVVREWLPRATSIANSTRHLRLIFRIAATQAELLANSGNAQAAADSLRDAIGSIVGADSNTLARAWGLLGNLSTRLGQPEVARDAYSKASALAEDASDGQLQCALAHSRVDVDYPPDERAEALNRCVEAYRELGDIRGEARALTDLATVLHADVERGLPIAIRALELHQYTGYRRGEAVTLQLLAHMHNGNTKAAEYARQSLAIRQEIDDREGMARAAIVLATTESNAGNNHEAEEALALAKRLSTHTRTKQLFKSATRQLKRAGKEE